MTELKQFCGRWLWPIAAVLVTATVLWNTLNNGWTTWDDQAYILDNYLVKNLKWETVKQMFSILSFNGGYTPIPMLSWAIDVHLGGVDPLQFHTTNLLLHLTNVVLCFWLTFALTKNHFASGLTALFFGIHPLHLEPVAWITGRKDLLLGMFSLLSLISWTYFLDAKRLRWPIYAVSILFLILALLSKATAVVIVPQMVLISWYFGKKVEAKSLLNIIPHLFVAIGAGLLAIHSQQQSTALVKLEGINFLESSLWAIQALGLYIINLLAPTRIGPFHPYPETLYSYLLPLSILVVIGIVLCLVWLWKTNRRVGLFGVCFMLIGLLPTLQFLPVGFALTADRYTYVPYIGGFIFLSVLLNEWSGRENRWAKPMPIVLSAGLLVMFGCQTLRYSHVWNSDLDLWNHVISMYPTDGRAYTNRGKFYVNDRNFTQAISDLNMATELNPDLLEAYNQQGLAFQAMNRYAEAQRAFEKVLSKNENHLPALQNLALNAYYQNEAELAQHYFDRIETIEPTNLLMLLNRGTLAETSGDLAMAENLYSKAQRFHPLVSKPYQYRGVVRFRMKRFEEAQSDFEVWSELDPRDPKAYRWLSRVNAELGYLELVIDNAKKASAFDGPLSDEELQQLISTANRPE